MTDYVLSVTVICSAADRKDTDRLVCAAGYAPWDSEKSEPVEPVMTVGLASNEKDEASHFMCHTGAAPRFIDLLNASRDGQAPPVDWSAYGLTQARALELLNSISVTAVRSLLPDSIEKALTKAGLVRVAANQSEVSS